MVVCLNVCCDHTPSSQSGGRFTGGEPTLRPSTPVILDGDTAGLDPTFRTGGGDPTFRPFPPKEKRAGDTKSGSASWPRATPCSGRFAGLGPVLPGKLGVLRRSVYLLGVSGMSGGGVVGSGVGVAGLLPLLYPLASIPSPLGPPPKPPRLRRATFSASRRCL